jgi:hypothetical protein
MRTDLLVPFAGTSNYKLKESMQRIYDACIVEDSSLRGRQLADAIYEISAPLVSDGYLTHRKNKGNSGPRSFSRIVAGERIDFRDDPMRVKHISHRGVDDENVTQHEKNWGMCLAMTMRRSGRTRPRNSGSYQQSETNSEAMEQIAEAIEEIEEITTTEEIATGTIKSDGTELLNWIQRKWRPLVENRNSTGDAMDSVGMRPALNGAKMLAQGIPVDAIKHALTMDYPSEIRRMLDVRDVDVQTLNPEPREGTGEKSDNELPTHKVVNYVLALARARVPIYLYGGKGVGKSELAKQLSEHLGKEINGGDPLPFGMVSMSPGTSPSAFFGRPKLSGDVTQSIFCNIIRNGGVFLFDEIDNGEAELLTLLNALMAQGFFANDATGEIIPVHENCIFMAAGNTIGNGSEGGYLRQPLDEATKDRWAAGRVRMELDEELETALYWRILA